MNLAEFLPQEVFAFIFILARLGTMVMLLPGIGEGYVYGRARIALAAMLSLVLMPLIQVPDLPDQPGILLAMLAGEVAIGFFMGMISKILFLVLDTAGVAIGMQAGLSNAMIFNPAMSQQAGVVSVFLMMIGIAIVFTTNLHYLALEALVDSYSLFVPGKSLLLADMADYLTHLLSHSFAVAMQIAAPMTVVALVFNVGMGLLARLMPQLQIFFIAMPVQLALSFMVMAVSLSAGLQLFQSNFETQLEGFLDAF